VHLLESALSNASEQVLEVNLFVAFNSVKHVLCAAVEVVLKFDTAVGEVVDEGTLLDVVVFRVNTGVLHLLLGVDQVAHLDLLSNISPLGSELSVFVASENVVEDSELGTEHEGEVSELNVAEVDGEEILVVENHVTDPLVVGPTSKTGDGGDGTNISEKEDETTAGSGERLVVGRDLLGANSLEESFHVAVMGEDKGVGLSVVGVHVARGGIAELIVVVAFAVLFHVLGLNTTSRVD
jgi:hypothetical protein